MVGDGDETRGDGRDWIMGAGRRCINAVKNVSLFNQEELDHLDKNVPLFDHITLVDSG